MKNCCVHLVEDDAGLAMSLQMFFASQRIPLMVYKSAAEFLKHAEWSIPGCIVLDMRMPGMGGEQLLAKLAAKPPMPPVIVLTAHGTIDLAVRALKAGAVDFLQKPCDSHELLKRVLSAIELDRQRMEGMARTKEMTRRLDVLTPREMDVVELLMAGLSSAEISAQLGLRPKSIEVYRSHILGKLGFSTTAELMSTLMREDPMRWTS